MSTIVRPMNGRPRGGHALAFALAAILAPGVLAAQQPQAADSSHCICWNQEAINLARNMPGMIAFGSHAMIGVTLAPDSGQGVHVEDVTAGGPAARAGLKAGDVITGIDDVDLGTLPASKAQKALVDHLGNVQPGDTVSVTYRRDGRTQNAKIVTESANRLGVFSVGPRARVFVNPGDRNFITPGTGAITVRRGDMPDVIRRTIVERTGASIPGLDVVDVNPKLGKYFDVDHGVLVVDVDSDSTLGLEPGDVILQIGDRAVEDAWHATRILRSYRSDEDIRMQIVRNGKHMTVTGHTR
jgi:S1-C subfamily serine protease